MAACFGCAIAILGILGALIVLLHGGRERYSWLPELPQAAILPVAALGTAVMIGLSVCLFRLGRRHARRRDRIGG